MSTNTSPDILWKQPGETVNFRMRFGDTGLIASGVTLSSPTSSILPNDGDLTISNLQVSGTNVLMTIAGGVDKTKYRITVTVTTSDSQTLQCDGILEVSTK